MSLPEWDGVSQHVIYWDDVPIPCVSVLGDLEDGWCASIPMENHCTLDLHVPSDQNPYVAIACSQPIRGWPGDVEWPVFWVAIEHEQLVLLEDTPGPHLSEGENLLHTLLIAGRAWDCDVDGPEEVMMFARKWGSYPVVRG